MEEAGLPGVGDWVVLREAPGPDRTTIIERVLARRTVFTRGAAGRQVRAQVVAANVDLVFAVCGLDADFNVRRIERYLARIWASGARASGTNDKAGSIYNLLRWTSVRTIKECFNTPTDIGYPFLGEE